nr:hypothetical protein KitaXyl93_76890 [Kitasatospora sp. Xyl93]
MSLTRDPAALALVTSATGYLLTLTALALTALTAPSPARRREARTLLALLLRGADRRGHARRLMGTAVRFRLGV